ncbi:MAG: DUF6088 family protein [Spirochaetales bacterium]|nr:DUF6088 family protein [Spirochaetales bacterium]
MPRETLSNQIKSRISNSQDFVFMPADFFDLSDRDQVGRVLRQLTREQFLVKIGYGVYVKTRVSQYTGKILPFSDLRTIAEVVLTKLGVEVLPTKYEIAYNSRQSTQVPNIYVVGVDKRINRKLSYGDASIRYAKVR